MPKLVFLVSEDWYFISHRLNLAREARAQGYEVVVCTRDSGQGKVIEATGARLVHFEQERRGLNPFGVLKEAWSLSKIYRTEKPDIVHHIALRSVVVGELASWIASVKCKVSAIAGLGFLFTGNGRSSLARSILQKSLPLLLSRSETIVQNADDARIITTMGVDPKRVHLIPGAGVDLDIFAPKPLTEGPLMVLLASRMLWDKGIGEFVEAARRLKRAGVRFVLAGMVDQHNPSSISASQLQAWEQEGVIEWWGHQADMVKCLNQADVVCLPSYREGFPKVLLEAMACAKPCIATDVPGCRDAVSHSDSGLLVPARDSAALSRAIANLLQDEDLRLRMGQRGRERAAREFSVERVTEQTFAVYRRLLKPPLIGSS